MDIKCVVCSEPWDSYGVTNGDMEKWEAHLFKQGAGCPCCKGKSSKKFEPKTIADFSNGDGDEMERIAAYENAQSGKAPPWQKPPSTVRWTCKCCGVQVISEPFEEEVSYHLPINAIGSKWYISHPYRNGDPEKEPFKIINKESYCEFCAKTCDGCDAPIVKHGIEEMYEEGWCSNLEGEGSHKLFCITCIENSCSECSCIECSCPEEDEDEETSEYENEE
jgi:hypothetical protein